MGMHLDPIACTALAGLIRHGIETHPPSVQAQQRKQPSHPARKPWRSRLTFSSNGTKRVYSYELEMSTLLSEKQKK
jgi:hypothetical protein